MTLAALLLGTLLLGGAHTWVQVRAGDALVPRWWAGVLGLLWSLGPLGLYLGGLAATLAALAWLVVGVTAVPMALHVDQIRRTHARLAQVGQREVDARRLLRRPSPPEVTRTLTPLGASSLDPEQDRERVAEAWRRVVERRRASA